MEGLTAHGRGEAFDYLIGETTTPSAFTAERTAAALLLSAQRPVISVNGNTAALAAGEVAELQKATGAKVEVNLFHRTEERVALIENLLWDAGADVFSGRQNVCSPSLMTGHGAGGKGCLLLMSCSYRWKTGTGARRS